MIKFTTIASEDLKFELSASIFDGVYKHPSLTINKEIMEDEEEGINVDVWDNSEWLLNKLLPVLKSIEKDPEDELGIRGSITQEEDEELSEIFHEGIQMGFFDYVDIDTSFTKDKGDSL